MSSHTDPSVYSCTSTGGRFGDVRVMGDPVADVRCQRFQRGRDPRAAVPRRPDDRQAGVRTNVVTPPRRDDVI